MNRRTLSLSFLALLPTAALAHTGNARALNWHAISIFMVFVLFTLGITRWAALRTRSAADFYTAGGGITGWQNGLAIAGDMISAASFLGISAIIFIGGFDGMLYSLGIVAAWPVILFLIAERLRNLGKYTFADVVSYRLEQTPIRITAASGTLVVALAYLMAQMVGAGKLIELLFGISYAQSVILVGVLMVCYVTLGGMLATTWVQIVKALMLLSGGTFMAFMVLKHFGYSLDALFAGAAEVHARKQAVMAPGGFFKHPVEALSLAVGMMFGTAGLPHILMRFFTVKDARTARSSVLYASGLIGYFYLLLIAIGFGAIVMVGTNPEFRDGAGAIIGGGNMVAVHLSKAVGGSLFLGFISAVAFATILAVVAGLTLSGASAVSHDLYGCVIRKNAATEREKLTVSRAATLVIGILAVILGIVFESFNIAFLSGLVLAIAASVNFPVLFLSMFWKGLTTRGAVAGSCVGLLSAVLLVFFSPAVWVALLHHEHALFPWSNPALFSMPLAFLAAWIFSITDHSARAEAERGRYLAQFIRSMTGIGASQASQH